MSLNTFTELEKKIRSELSNFGEAWLKTKETFDEEVFVGKHLEASDAADAIVKIAFTALTEQKEEFVRGVETKKKSCLWIEGNSSLENHIKVFKEESYNRALEDVIRELEK